MNILKKLFLSIVIILATASFAFAQSDVAEPGWLADEKSNCKIFTTDKKQKSVKYEGNCVDGFADGLARYELFKDGAKFAVVIGNLVYGRLNGDVIVKNVDGSKFYGEYKEGYPHGKGQYTHSDGTKYEGEFNMGKITGKGVLTKIILSQSDLLVVQVHEGVFQNGNLEGAGIIKETRNGQTIVETRGNFINGLINGKGEVKLILENGIAATQICEKFINGKKNGKCIMHGGDGYKEEIFYENDLPISKKK